MTRTVAAVLAALAFTPAPAVAKGSKEGGAADAIEAAQAAEAAKRIDKPCPGIDVPAAAPQLPYGAGEELAYDVTWQGIYIGRFETKVGKPRVVGGQKVVPLFGRARTNSFASQFEKFLGRYMTFIDPETQRPQVLRVEGTYGKDRRREDARFISRSAVRAEFTYEGLNGVREYARKAPMLDLISTLYFARTRALAPGLEACQEVYADRRLWRMEARVKGVEDVKTPAGDKPAFVIETTWDRLPHPDFDPKRPAPHIDMDVYLSTDAARTPLSFRVRSRGVEVRGELVRWAIDGREDDSAWTF